MPNHPLAEVFGFPVDNFSPQAERYRKHRLCPYNNRVANCTKDKASDPLGVCSVFEADQAVAITCPIRFRQDWLITDDAAAFFFPPDTTWTSLTEVRLNDQNGQSAGNIDVVLVAYDDRGRVTDFGSLEVQGVYISGNVRRPFERYMSDPKRYYDMDWSKERNYPRPDYLSSSRKRLAPQLLYKGGILSVWGKKQAVALHRGFFNTLPTLTEVEPHEAEIAWLVYDLTFDASQNLYRLGLHRAIYTSFQVALDQIATPQPGPMVEFMEYLQEKLDEKLEQGENPPDAPILSDLL
jgi:hypothetical protein